MKFYYFSQIIWNKICKCLYINADLLKTNNEFPIEKKIRKQEKDGPS